MTVTGTPPGIPFHGNPHWSVALWLRFSSRVVIIWLWAVAVAAVLVVMVQISTSSPMSGSITIAKSHRSLFKFYRPTTLLPLSTFFRDPLLLHLMILVVVIVALAVHAALFPWTQLLWPPNPRLFNLLSSAQSIHIMFLAWTEGNIFICQGSGKVDDSYGWAFDHRRATIIGSTL